MRGVENARRSDERPIRARLKDDKHLGRRSLDDRLIIPLRSTSPGVIPAAIGAKRRVNCCCSYGAWEFFRGQFQSLADDGRMFATENSEPDSVGNRYSGLTHFDALLEQTKRTIRAQRPN